MPSEHVFNDKTIMNLLTRAYVLIVMLCTWDASTSWAIMGTVRD